VADFFFTPAEFFFAVADLFFALDWPDCQNFKFICFDLMN
jgi:hypothetical protein